MTIQELLADPEVPKEYFLEQLEYNREYYSIPVDSILHKHILKEFEKLYKSIRGENE